MGKKDRSSDQLARLIMEIGGGLFLGKIIGTVIAIVIILIIILIASC